jgi:NAD-dependent dihydropyrimidine dehydrogenase PreA subunit
MIKLTYQIICDICKKECKTEKYECTNYPTMAFPQPTQQHTFIFGYSTELCYDCAAPLQAARNEVVAKYKRSLSEDS